jgi:two-component system OmpR family response regulator
LSDPITIKKELDVLIIDDNEQITKMVSTFLTLSNYKCTISNDAKDGLDLMREKNFDAILLDLAMPDFDGYAVLEQVKDSDIPSKIIVLTASNITQENMEKIQKIGVNSILFKPVDIDKLLLEIMSIKNS